MPSSHPARLACPSSFPPAALPSAPTSRYEPDTTAAIILTGGDEEAEAAAAEVCREAEITVVVKQSEEAEPTTYLTHGKPQE